ncbi:hypothetical protein PG994_004304 [Apiospora phragmitis]|uniref:Uncharacterized protein n=1 Tax=Apiospora phragmitis TaxID=2905665 RepID=A0ABR1VQ86_9PEZI
MALSKPISGVATTASSYDDDDDWQIDEQKVKEDNQTSRTSCHYRRTDRHSSIQSVDLDAMLELPQSRLSNSTEMTEFCESCFKKALVADKETKTEIADLSLQLQPAPDDEVGR